MSKILTFEVQDELYEAFEQMAKKYGTTTEAIALEWLAKQASERRSKLSEEELKAARERFERHFGAWDSGDPNSADNERIDADLAREYGNTHEKET